MTNNSNTQNSGDNIDITQIPNDDLDALSSAIETFYKQDGAIKQRLSYSWERNRRFIDGDQWLVYNGNSDTGGVWQRLSVSKTNEYIPRPVTNYIFDGYQTLKSYLIKVKPRSTIRPNTDTFKDKAAAKVAELCLETNWERLKEQENYEYAAACLIADGTIFKKSFWDTSSSTVVKIPRTIQQPVFDPMTGIQTGSEDVEALDEEGVPIMDILPLGDVSTTVVEAFRIAVDPLCSGLHDAKWIMEYGLHPISWVKEVYSKQGDGYTGLAETLTEETALSSSMQRYWNSKFSAGTKGDDKLAKGGSGNTELTNQVVLKEYYEAPTQQHPKGRRIVVGNGKTLFVGEALDSGIDLGDWHPYSECRWEIPPGRFWGKGPVDNACDIQKQINSIDATIILTRKTMAIPQKLIPAGSGIEPGQWTGRPGQQITYRSENGKPEIIPGVGVDSSVFAERAQRVEDLKNVMGAIDILKGDRPPGVNAASALSLLHEVGTGKLSPVHDRWKRFVENDQKKQLKIIASGYKEPRPDYIKMLKSRNKELSDEVIDKFLGTDLLDNCNVIIEAGSNVPKLQSVAQMRLQEAAQVGTLNLAMPSNRMEYNRQMGIVGFDNDVGPDIKRAEWENDLMDNVQNNPDKRPIVLEVDQDDVHLEVLERRMKEPSWMEAPLEVQQAYMTHREDHLEAKAKKEQQAAIQAAALGQAPQAQGGNLPTPVDGSGKGVPQNAKEGVLRADMPPGTMPR
jgi:hypothetical protein